MLLLDAATVFFFALVWLGLVAFLRSKKGRGSTDLLFFTLFYVYLCKVVEYTLLQFQFQFLQYLVPGRLMLRGNAAMENLNLIPLVALTSQDVRTSLLNVLLFVPFGFGLPFVTPYGLAKTVIVGAACSFVIEALQLLTGLLTKVSFRIADVNDLIFNTLGATLGYVLFVGFVRGYRRLTAGTKFAAHPVSRHIVARPQV